ncbi:MAG TPA: phospholipase D-like domain-containing protein [Candidatus Deferrimicrobium sp.]|nr:phospholipase D-like domain-containing protein [Candidatus Deferrimicrobium sp.]
MDGESCINPNDLKLISFKNRELFEKVISKGLVKATKSLLIGTYNLQDIKIQLGNSTTSLSKVLIELLKKNVRILICLAPFMFQSQFIKTLSMNDFAREKISIRFCKRMHFKTIIVDLRYAYIGTANLSGAGVGLKSDRRRNFELGFVTQNSDLIADIAGTFMEIFSGKYCSHQKCYFFDNYRIASPCQGIFSKCI